MSTAIGAGISGVFGEKPGSGVSAYDNIYSVHFDSPAQRINCGDSSSFSFPGTVASDRAFSISTWVYFVDTVNSVQICGKGDVGTADAEYNLETDSAGRVRIRLYDSNVSSTSTSYWQGRNDTNLETNKWYHIVATFDGTTPNAQSNSIRIYVNNQLNNVVTRVNTPGPFVQMFDNGGKFILGTTDGVNSKNIYMDEAAIFNRALTQSDINYLYSIPFTPNLTVNGNFTELGPELNPNSTFDNLGGELVTCGDFSCADPNDSWDLYESGSSTVTFTDVASINIDGSNSNAGLYQQNIFENSKTYKIVLTMKATAIFDAEILETEGAATRTTIGDVSLTTSYQEFTFYFIGTGNYDLFIHRKFGQTAGQNQQILISNVSVKEISAITGYSDNGQGDPTPAILSWDSSTQNLEFTSFQAGRGAFNNGTVDTPNLIIPISSNKTYLVSCESATSTTTHGIRIGSTQISASFWESNYISTPRKIERFITNYSSSIQQVFLYLRNALAGTTQWSEASVKEVTDWTFGDGWSVNSSNQAEYDGTGTTASALEQTVATYEDGKKYQVQFQLDGSLNGVAVSINGGTAVNALRSTTDNSSRSVTVIAGSGSNSLKITPLGATDTFTMSDITSKLVTSLAAPNTDKDDARAVDLTGMSDLDHWWRMGDTQGPATYPVIHDVVYNPFGDQLVDNGSFDELGPQLIKNPLFGLGPELVTNGDFATDSDWNKGNKWSISGGTANKAADATSNISQAIDGISGKLQKVVFTVSNYGGNGGVGASADGSNYTENEGNGTFTEYITPNSNNLYIRASYSFVGSIDNVSVKEVPHWTLGSKWSIEGDSARLISNDSNGSGLYQDNIFSANKTYLITFDAVVREGEAKVEKGGGQILQRIDQTGSYSVYLRTVGADAGVTRLYFNRLTSIADVSISNISVKQVDPEDDWNLTIGDTIIEEGVAKFPTSTNSFLIQNFVVDLSVKNYKLTYEVVSTNGNNFRLAGGNSAFGTVTLDSATIGTKTAYLTSNGTKQNLQFNNNNFVGSIDNVSVQQVSDTSGIMENMNPDNIVAFSPPDPDPLVGDEFIFSVNTAQSGVSNSDQFQLPLISAGTLDFTVIWGDGTQDIITSYNQAETLHTYPSSGTYTIGIRANTEPLKGFKFNAGGDKFKMSNIVNWGGSNFRLDQQEAFYGCSNMTCTATDAPIITATSFYRMFRGCANFDGDLSNWDVSGVNSLNQMFYSCNAFTGKGLENWDISSADRIEYMFYNCPNFNGQIGGWDTSGVTTMRNTFRLCSIFNQDISSWDTSLVAYMNNMFEGASEFNQPLNSWDVSSCVNFASMFKNAIKFNQPLNNWTIKNDAEIDMNAMFFNANRFNQDVSMWDVSRVRYMQYMFFSCADMSFGFDGWDTSSVDNFYGFADYMDVLDTSFGYLDVSSAINIGSFKNNGQTISTENYNNTLIGWAAQTVNPNLTTSFGNATYSYSAFDARNTLTSAPNNWTITDGGYVPTDNAFQFTVNPNLQTLGNQLVTNGDFATNLNNWQTSSWWTWNVLGAYHPPTNLHKPLYQQTCEAGKTYRISFDLNVLQGRAKVSIGTNTGYTTQVFATNLDSGSYIYEITAQDEYIIFNRSDVSGNNEYYVDNVSVKEVLSDTNQFEIPLVNQGTQDFVVDWGDGEQDKITAWDDAAKLHSYYTYGSELLNVSSLSGSNWTPDGSGGFTNNGSGGGLSGSLSVTTTPGATYRLTFDVTISGVANAAFGGVTIPNFTTSGPKEYYVTATSSSTSFNFYLATSGSPSMFVNNISVVEQTPDTTPKTISIDGTIQGWKFDAPGDYLKLNNINRWGALEHT